MSTHKYRIYYEWQGKTPSDPFAREKTPDEVADALERAPTEFRVRLDAGASVEAEAGASSSEIVLTVSTSGTEEDVTRALVPTLQDWHLFGTKLS